MTALVRAVTGNAGTLAGNHAEETWFRDWNTYLAAADPTLDPKAGPTLEPSAGPGPKSGGLSLGGQHFHHYNLGIAGLTGLGSLLVQAEARERMADHPLVPTSYGVSTALIADEAALLLNLQDVYWSPQGRKSVDIAIGIIATGGLGVALVPFVQHFYRRTPH